MKIEELSPENLLVSLACRKKALNSLIKIKHEDLKSASTGSLYASTCNNNFQYYWSKHKKNETTDIELEKKKYLSKDELEKAKSLAQKHYDTELIKSLEEEHKLINELILYFNKKEIDTIFEKFHPGKQVLIRPVTLTQKDYAKKWLDFRTANKKSDDRPKNFETTIGIRVRSKSEVLIAEILAKKNIPFRYEYPLYLNGYRLYPDFLCLNLRARKEFVWEHFGMMDDVEYAENAVTKINAYITNGFFPGDNFISTSETLKSPLSSKIIERIIEKYLL